MHKVNEDGTISIRPSFTANEANIIGTLKAQHAIEMQKLQDEIYQLKAENERLRKVKEIDNAYYESYIREFPVLKSVTYNPPVTIAFWKDGTKTVSKCSKKDVFSKECGLALCYMYKIFGKKATKEILREHCWTIPAYDFALTCDGSAIAASKLTINCTDSVPENSIIFSDAYKKELTKLIDEIIAQKEISKPVFLLRSGW